MTVSVTPRVLRAELAQAIKTVLRHAVDDLLPKTKLEGIGRELGYEDGQTPRKWARESAVDDHLPVWALCNRQAIPDAVYARIIAKIESIREQQTGQLISPVEVAAKMFAAGAAESVGTFLRLLDDGKIAPSEEPAAYRVIGEVEQLCAKMKDALESRVAKRTAAARRVS